jgi:hypothetical protein
MIEAAAEVRDRLALPLDVGDLDAAIAMAQRVAPWFGIAKVGYELYAEAGPAAFDRLHDLGFTVFCDLKLHDIPNTVERGAAALARHGVRFMNAHAAGGSEMLQAFVAGAERGDPRGHGAHLRCRRVCVRRPARGRSRLGVCRSGVQRLGTRSRRCGRASFDGAGNPSRGCFGRRPVPDHDAG